MKHQIVTLLIISMLALSCEKNYTEGISPAQRNADNIEKLRNRLTQAKYGWRMIYFSKSDSLLFTNKNEILQNTLRYRDLYGYGGHYFLLKFNEDGTVKMRSDFTDKSIKETKESEFVIQQNTFTELSFTTYNYLHKLINDKFEGASDFLYVEENFDNDLVFKTSSYIYPAKEYVLLQELDAEEAWDEDIEKSYENRKFFDDMKNPQITIRKGDRIFFKSDYVIKTNSPVESYKKFLEQIPIKRYYVFEFNTVDDPFFAENKPKTVGLGSGYVGTEKGMFFYPGIRYDKKFIFYDFERQGDKFVCELVRIYDPIRRVFMYVSKYRYPEGEPTFMVAEIKDEPVEE